jgi:hypothetical protein
MVKRFTLALAIAATAAASARADTLVFPVEGASAAAGTRLTRALLAAADTETPRLADTPLGEAASLLECTAPERACLDSIAQATETAALLAATVKPAGGSLAAHIIYHRRGGEPESRDVELPLDAEAAAPILEREARALIHGSSAAAEPAPAAAPLAPSRREEVVATSEQPSGFSFRRVRPWAWAVAGAGAVLVGVGAVFAVKASGLESDVEQAPRDTVMDLEHLKDLEDQGDSATSISNALLIGGSVALVGGAALVIWQGFRPSAEERGPALTVAPVRGGAAMVLSGELP